MGENITFKLSFFKENDPKLQSLNYDIIVNDEEKNIYITYPLEKVRGRFFDWIKTSYESTKKQNS
jgi:hypothetical protein